MVEILGFPCHGPGSIPGQRTEILQAGLAKKKEIVQSQGHRRESTGWKPVTLRAGSWLRCCLAGKYLGHLPSCLFASAFLPVK